MSSATSKFSLREERYFFRDAKKTSGKYGSLYVLLKKDIHAFVVVVPKTPICTSVKRNLIKRRVRSVFSSLSLKNGVFVYVAREITVKKTFTDLRKEIVLLTTSYEQKN